MIFNSIEFLLFFCAVLGTIFFVPQKYKWLLLLLASYLFYGWGNPEFLPLLIVPTLLVYVVALKLPPIKIEARKKGDEDEGKGQKKRKWWLIAGLFFALTGLVVFKLTDFIGSSVFSVIKLFAEDVVYKPVDFILPFGVSFFSFKLVSYLIDVYNGNCPVEKHPGYFALYVSFFPQILAGPIDRAVHFIPQLKANVSFDVERVLSGFRLVVWGIFKKMVVADRLAVFVGEVFKSPEHQGINLLFGAYFYAIQIYCDFSGYSDIAVGVSRMLGYKSMENFDFPYFAAGLTQFWSKWHISLSTWLRDYLFLPIAYAVMRPIKGPKKFNVKAETWGYVIGMFITMFLGGLWHGASWTFVAWGSLHGIYLVVGYTTKKLRKRWRKKVKLSKFPALKNAVSILITFHLVSFAWIFFRAESFEKAFTYIKYLQLKMPVDRQGLAYLVFNLVLVLVFMMMEVVYKNRSKWTFLKKIPAPVKIALFALFICVIIILSVDGSNEFIYLQF